MKYRRLVAGVGLVGAGALALLAGPASAHNWNGNPSAPGSTLDETPPAGPDGKHVVTMTLGPAAAGTNSISKSRPPGCDTNDASFTGGVCSVEHIRFNLSSPAFGGTPNHPMAVLMCNSKLAAPTIDGGGNDPTGACDAANARGISSLGVTGSGAFTLDVSGNLPANPDNGQCAGDPGLGCGDAGVQLNVTSCVTNTAPAQAGQPFEGGLASLGSNSCGNPNPNATCPPNPSHIATGWPCIVALAEFVGVTPGDHVGFRVVQLKPPIPVSTETAANPNVITSVPPLCNGVPCTPGASGSFGPIAPGVDVKITGRRFPCHTTQPDDPSINGGQNACLVAHTAKQVLVKRITTQLLEPSAVVLSQTAQTDGRYEITFDMPNVVGVGFGDSYRFVPHAPNCAFNQGPSVTDPNYPKTCESQNHNASGIRLFQN